MKLTTIKNQKGITLVEVLVTMLLASIVTVGICKAFATFIRSNVTVKSNVVIQEHIIRANKFLEKDIRMTGLYLPGNGLELDLSNADNHQLSLYYNKENRQTTLPYDTEVSNDYIMVDDIQDVVANETICLSDGTEIKYFQIASVEDNQGAPDRVYLTGATISRTWSSENTTAVFAKRIKYEVETDSNGKSLVRHSLNNDFTLSDKIDMITVTPKDSLGVAITSQYDDSRYISVALNSTTTNLIGNGNVSNTLEIAIKNVN